MVTSGCFPWCLMVHWWTHCTELSWFNGLVLSTVVPGDQYPRVTIFGMGRKKSRVGALALESAERRSSVQSLASMVAEEFEVRNCVLCKIARAHGMFVQ